MITKHMPMLVRVTLISLIFLQEAYTSNKFPCDSGVENGYSYRGEGELVHFKCNDNYALIKGPSVARCQNNFLDISELPTCTEKLPQKPRVRFTYENIECTDDMKNMLISGAMEMLSDLGCLSNKLCSIRNIEHECPQGTLRIIQEVVFDTLDTTKTSDEIANYVGTRQHLRRKKRDDPIPNPSDTGTVFCDPGQARIPALDVCIDCPKGQYGSNDVCIECPVGEYATSQRSVSCTKCTDGTTTVSTGSEAATECVVACTFAATENAVYQVDSFTKNEGEKIAAGVKYELVCNSGYYLAGDQAREFTCVTGTTTETNCYQITREPTASNVYYTSSTSADVTCKVTSATAPTEFILAMDNGQTEVNNWDKTKTATTVTDNSDHSAVFQLSAGGSYTCMATIGSEGQYVPNDQFTSVSLSITNDPSAATTKYEGESVTLTASATYDSGLPNTVLSWKKDGNSYNTDVSQSTTSDNTFFQAQAVFNSLTLENRGTYDVEVSFRDQQNNEQVTGSTSFILNVIGFITNTVDNFEGSLAIKYIVQGTAKDIKCKVGYSATAVNVRMQFKAKDGVYTDLTTTGGSTAVGTGNNEWEITYNIASAATSNSGSYRCVISDGTNDKVTGSSVEVSVVEGLGVEMDNEKVCTSVGAQAVITCTANYPDSQVTTPYVKFYKLSGSESQLISDATGIVTTGTKDEANKKWVATLSFSAIETENAGEYYCEVNYPNDPLVVIASTASTDTSKQKTKLTVFYADDIAKQYKKVGDGVTLTATFHGAMYATAEFRYAGATVGGNPSYDSATGTTTLTYNAPNAALDSIRSYDAYFKGASADCPVSQPEVTKVALVEILNANVTISVADTRYGVEAGTDVTITCKFSNPSGVNPTVSWTKDGTAITAGVDNTAEALSPGISKLAVSSVDNAKSGMYTCSVDYSGDATVTGVQESLNLLVRGANTMNDNVVITGAQNSIFTCSFYGISSGVSTSIEWTKASTSTTPISSGIDATTTDNGVVTSILTITAPSSNDEYTCKLSAAAGGQNVFELRSTARIIMIQIESFTSTNSIANEGDAVGLYCLSTDLTTLAPDLTKETVITLNGNEVFRSTTSYKYNIDSAAYTNNGVYTCKVTFGTDSVDTMTLNQYVRYIASTSAAFAIGGRDAILSCVFYGDDLDVANTPVSWTNSGVTLTTGSDYTLSDGSYDSATLTRTATLTINTYDTSKNGEYFCYGTYNAPGATLSSTVTLSGVELTSFQSDAGTVDAGGSFSITCAYTHTVDAVVSWTKNSLPFSDATELSQGVYGFKRTSNAVKEDNGEYVCMVDYGTSVGTLTSNTVTQYVREVVPLPSTNVYSDGMASFTITCEFYGDESSTEVWKKGNVDVSNVDGADIGTVTSYAEYKITVPLIIDPLTLTAFEAVYTCSATYTAGSASKEAMIDVKKLIATVSAMAVQTLGKALTLTCETTSGYTDTITYSWAKDAGSLTGTDRTYEIATTSDDDTDSYTCTATYGSTSVTSNPHQVFIQSISVFAQHAISTYNEVGETLTLTGTVKATVEPTLAFTKDGEAINLTPNVELGTNANEYTFTVTTTAAKPSTGNTVTFKATATIQNVNADAPTKELTLDVYNKCTLPNDADITAFDGSVKDHMWTTAGITCLYGKQLIFGTKATCKDGVLEYMTSDDSVSVQPKCVDISSIASSKVRADVGNSVTLTCQYTAQAVSSSTSTTASLTPVITWAKKDSSGDTDVWTTLTGTGTGGSSNLELGTVSVDDNGEYRCTAKYGTYPDIQKTIMQYVLYKDVDSNIVVMTGEKITLTCTFYGDITSAATTWSLGGAVKSSATGYTITDDNTAYLNKRVSTFVIASVNADTDSGEWSCKVIYTADAAGATTKITATKVEKPTVTGTLGLTVGMALSLTCASNTDISGATKAYKWTNKATSAVLSQTTATYSIAQVDYADALTYVCTITFGDKGSADADDAVVTVQGIKSITQSVSVGNYNEEDENIEVRAGVITTQTPITESQITFKLDGVVQNSTYRIPADPISGQYFVYVPFVAKRPSTGNTVTVFINITNDHGTMTNSVDIMVYNYCTAPSVDNLSDLSGQKMDHEEEITGMQCSSNYKIQGGSTVKCVDGTLTYSASNTETENTEPKCIGFATQPVSTLLLQVGDKGKLTCKTNPTILTVNKITWSYDSTTLYEDSTMITSSATNPADGTYYGSVLGIDGDIAMNQKDIKCTVQFTDSNNAVSTTESTLCKLSVAGTKSVEVTGYSGAFIEIDKANSSKSDSYTITIQAYADTAPSLTSFKVTDKSNTEIPFTAGTTNSTSKLRPYTYMPTEDNKKNVVLTITVTYSGFTSALTKTYNVFVYAFCKHSSLPDVSNGAWSPLTDAEHHGLVTLTCNDNYFSVGTSTAVCGERASGEFYIPNTPTCQATNELTCGKLDAPTDGYIIYENSNKANYYCNPEHVLIGDTSTECNTVSGVWSHRDAENSEGKPPICAAVKQASKRTANVKMYFILGSDYCRNDDEVHNFEDALLTSLHNDGSLTCIQNNTCTLTSFSCSVTNLKATIDFTLQQTFHLESASLLTHQVNAVVSKSHTIAISVTPVKRSIEKRATVSAETDPSTPSTATVTATCNNGGFSHNGNCITCPLGSGKSGDTCQLCPLGTFSAADDDGICQDCTPGLTTLNTGSTNSNDCVTSANLCTVKDTPANGHLFPTTGSKIAANTMVTLSCEKGYDLMYSAAASFSCNEQAYPACYRTCDISMYNPAKLEEMKIDAFVSTTPLKHGQTLKVNCISKYHFEKDINSRTFTCKGDGTAEESMIQLEACVKSDSVTLIVIIVLVVLLGLGVLLLFLFIFIQWRKKRNDHYNGRGDGRRRDMHEMDKFETPTTDQDKQGTLTIRNNSTNNSYNSTNNDYNDCNDYNDYNDYNSNNDYNDYNSNNEYNL